MKKLMTTLLTICGVALAALPLLAQTETVDGITWTYTVANGTASVGGGSSSSPAVPTTTTGSITIPSSLDDYIVTSIGNYAFCNCTNLTSVAIPNSVTSIGNYAFYNCSGLTSVTISNSVTSIGEYAFQGCSGLTSITIPNSVTNIGKGAFSGCSSLVDMTLPFVGSKRGNQDDYEACFGYIFGNYSYTGCTSAEQHYTEGTSVMPGYSTFYLPASLKSLTITDETVLGRGAFYNCTRLTDITIPNSLKSIRQHAFCFCKSLTSVTISDSVTSIGMSAFWDCESLTSVTIGNSVTSIGDGAFGYCSSLASLSMLRTPMSFGSDVFYNCKSLTSVTIPQGIRLSSVFPSSYQIITNAVICDSVKTIGNSVFDGCTSLTSVAIPSSVTNIENCAFYGCSALGNVEIPDSVVNIGIKAFYGCSALGNVEIPDSVANIGNQAFYGCNNLANEDGFIIIRDVLHDYIGTAQSVAIPESVTSIGASAFYNSTGLTSVTIPDSVTNIGEDAFRGCSNLTSVNIPDSVTGIGDRVFYYCSGLTNVSIPSSVTSIGGWAFGYCSSLMNVTMNGYCPTLGYSVFSGVSSDCVALLPYGDAAYGVTDGKWQGMAVEYFYLYWNVSFDSNGGVGFMEPQVFTYGIEQALPESGFTREHATFAGWATAADGDIVYSDGQSIMVAEDLTLYAKWAMDQYIVTFDANGGTGGTSESMDYGAAIVPPVVSKAGYTFAGWIPEVEQTVPASNVTYCAQWIVNQYSLTSISPHGRIYPVDETAVFTNGEEVVVSVPEEVVFDKVKYVCSGWNQFEPVNASGEGCSASLVITGDTVVAWSWTTNYWGSIADVAGCETDGESGWYSSGLTLSVSAVLPTA